VVVMELIFAVDVECRLTGYIEHHEHVPSFRVQYILFLSKLISTDIFVPLPKAR